MPFKLVTSAIIFSYIDPMGFLYGILAYAARTLIETLDSI